MSRQSSPDRYAVLACSSCHDYYLAGDPGSQESVTCPHCGVSRHPDQIRKVGEHPEREGAAELRARQLARDARCGSAYAGVDDYGVLGDRLRDDQLIPPHPETGWHPSFFETASESVLSQREQWFEDRAEDALGTGEDWFSEAATNAGVDHPGAAVVDELLTERESSAQDVDVLELPGAGDLTLTTDTHISPACSVAVDDDMLAPTALQTILFKPDGDVADAVLDAIETLTSECPSNQDVATYLFERGVTALDGAYARLVSEAVSSLAVGDWAALWRLLSITRSLGGQTELHLGSSLDDIRDGPIALLALADETPTVEFRLERSFFDAKSTQRKRFLHHLHRLNPGVDVRIVGSRLTLQKVLDKHGDDLPTSVSEDAQQRLRSRETASTITEQRAEAAVDALEDLGLDHPAWDLLVSVAQTQTESRSYADCYADRRFDVGESAIRRRIRRLRDAGVAESIQIDGDAYVTLTPVGQVALDKHPELDRDTPQPDSGAHPSSSAGWSTGHTEETKPPDSSATQPTVSDPRTDHNSTVYSQYARERGGQPEAGDTSGSSKLSSHSSPSSDSSLSPEYLSLSEHHATAAAASTGHFALVDRSLSETAVGRDHRKGRFSYDPEREEVVVSVDFSPTIALTAVRLCAVLLSDNALNQVLTPERLAGHPDGMSLDGLAVSNPYVLRDAACLGWLRDVDATGNGLHSRLEQARRDLLAMTDDLRDKDGLDEDMASELLQMAHGLMGVALRLYDLLEIDVVRELQFPTGAPDKKESRHHLRQFLAVATSVGSRYGAYSGYRVLHESRAEKREQLLSEPNVDPMDPTGTLLGSWVLTGEDVEALENLLSRSPGELELQEESEKFAPFMLDGTVVDGNRRTAVAEAITRILSFKDGLRPDRQAISVIAALSSDIVAGTEAVAALGAEDEPRGLDMQDVRYGLSQLPPDQLVPDLGGTVVSKVMAALLDAQERLSTAELADLAGCSTRSLSTEMNERVFAELEAMGLLERDALGEGKKTVWRLRLSFRSERCDEDAPAPRMLVGEKTTASGGEWHLSNAVSAVLTTAADEHGVTYRIPFGGDLALKAFAGPPPIDRELEPLISAYPSVEPVVSLLASLLDQTDRIRGQPSTVQFGVAPAPDQTTLREAVSS